jgi:thiosulfate dehydrogenase (quinone) large subunit
MKKNIPKSDVQRIEDPPFARSLFGDVRWAWLWLIIRLFVGWRWLQAGLGKIGSPAWTGDNAGAAISGFVGGALAQTGGENPNVQGWYAWFLQTFVQPYPAFWGYLVSWGELLVGIALLLGIFTGIAAFFGAFMNMNYMLAGTSGINPIMFMGSLFLILAWKTAGWWGLDRWVLPALGTPWRPGYIFKSEPRDPGSRPSPDAGLD